MMFIVNNETEIKFRVERETWGEWRPQPNQWTDISRAYELLSLGKQDFRGGRWRIINSLHRTIFEDPAPKSRQRWWWWPFNRSKDLSHE